MEQRWVRALEEPGRGGVRGVRGVKRGVLHSRAEAVCFREWVTGAGSRPLSGCQSLATRDRVSVDSGKVNKLETQSLGHTVHVSSAQRPHWGSGWRPGRHQKRLFPLPQQSLRTELGETVEHRCGKRSEAWPSVLISSRGNLMGLVVEAVFLHIFCSWRCWCPWDQLVSENSTGNIGGEEPGTGPCHPHSLFRDRCSHISL